MVGIVRQLSIAEITCAVDQGIGGKWDPYRSREIGACLHHNGGVRWSGDLGIQGSHAVRDLWRQRDLGEFKTGFSLSVAAHSAELVKIAP